MLWHLLCHCGGTAGSIVCSLRTLEPVGRSRDGDPGVDVARIARVRSGCRYRFGGVPLVSILETNSTEWLWLVVLLRLIAEDEYRRALLAPEALEFVGDRGGHVDEGAEDEIVVAVAIQVAGFEGDPPAGHRLA